MISTVEGLYHANKSFVLKIQGVTLTDALEAGRVERGAATQIQMDHDHAVVLQNLPHRVVAQPLFLHREVYLGVGGGGQM